MARKVEASIAPEQWKRALGRFLDSCGFTLDEWKGVGIGAERAALILAIQHILDCLRLQQTQADLLERDALLEDWQPRLDAEFGKVAAVLREADPAAIAYGLRWCELLLDRRLDVAPMLDQPPESVVQWTRDVG